MTRRAAFAPSRFVLGWLAAAALASASLPSQARESNSGWVTAPDVRQQRRVQVERGEQLLPGWARAPKLDKRVKTFALRGPRSFGLLTGDRVHHRVLVAVEAPYRLQHSSLPPSRWVNSWLELADVGVHEARHDGVNRYLVHLNYQIFATPRSVTLDVIPGFELRFGSESRSFAVAVPHWRFSISPLLKPEPEVEAIADIPLRADAPPAPVDASLPAYGLAVFGGLSAIFGAGWLYLNSVWPFGRRRQAPFRRACRALGAIGRRPRDEQALQDAFRVLHRAFDETAGEVLFAERLERFFASRAAFASRRAGIEAFFAKSREVFFAGGSGSRPVAGVDLAWLAAICRQCRAAEREAR